MTALYVETVHGDPTIWLRTPENPNGDTAAMIRTGANAAAFDAIAALVEASQTLEADRLEAWQTAARRRNEARRYYVAWMSARMRAQEFRRLIERGEHP